MTCQLVSRLMRLVETNSTTAVRFAIYRSGDGRLLCHCDRLPINEDSSHGEGRGIACLCEALRQLETSNNIPSPVECNGCGEE